MENIGEVCHRHRFYVVLSTVSSSGVEAHYESGTYIAKSKMNGISTALLVTVA